MKEFLRRRWFMLLLFVAIPWGLWLGYHATPDRVSTFPKWIVEVAGGVLQSLVLFLMSVTLDRERFARSLRYPGPVLWGTMVNLLLLPAVTVLALPLQGTRDFAVGLMIAASVPATMATASVWTRKAGGNDAISLLITIITNSLCFLATPFWLWITFGSRAEINALDLMGKLFATALVPILFGQWIRRYEVVGRYADRSKVFFGVIAQSCVLLLIFWASVQGGVKLNPRIESSGSFPLIPFLMVCASAAVLHFTGLVIALVGGVLWRFSREDNVGAIFSASQKTLPVGLFVASGLVAQGQTLAALPMLVFYALQLMIDTLLTDRLRQWVQRGTSSEGKAEPSAV